jgi:hypothetical protein
MGRSLKSPVRSRKTSVSEPIPTYEERLARDSRWALSEGSKFFEGKSDVQETLRKITGKLREMGIDYAVAGALGLFHHGYRRFTEDVDLLVTREGLKVIHHQLEGLGYLPPFQGSKHLRDMITGVKIEFLVTGEFPGDGKPKPVAFPDPRAVVVENDGIRYLNLPTLVELKIASGMTSSERLKDLADVQELIKILNLPADFAANLNAFVRDKFAELWHAARPPMKRYVRIWSREDGLAALEAMQADGVTIEPGHAIAEDSAYLVTTDPEVAKKHDMHDEAGFLEEEEDTSQEAGK